MNLPFYEVLEQYKKKNQFLFESDDDDLTTNVIWINIYLISLIIIVRARYTTYYK